MHKKCPIFKNDVKLDIDQYIAPKHHKSYLACIMNLNSEFNLLQDQSQSKLISKLNQTLIISSIIQRCRKTIFIQDKVTAILNQNWHQSDIECTNRYMSDNYFQ